MITYREQFLRFLSVLRPRPFRFDSVIRTSLLKWLPEKYVLVLERELTQFLHNRRSAEKPKPSEAREASLRLAARLKKLAGELSEMDNLDVPPGISTERFDAIWQGMEKLGWAITEAVEGERALEIWQRESQGKENPTRAGGPRIRHDEQRLARRVLGIIGAVLPSVSDDEKNGYALAVLKICLIPLGVSMDVAEKRTDSLLSKISSPPTH